MEPPRRPRAGLLLTLPLWVVASAGCPAASLRFTEVGEAAGIALDHGFLAGAFSELKAVSGGVAVGDVDGDGWLDLYLVRGDAHPDALLRNLGDGRFEEIGEAAGVALVGLTSGPGFFDADGDGRVDLLVGGIEETSPRFFHNVGGGRFEESTERSGITADFHSLGHGVGDFDRDGDLDVYMARWGTFIEPGHGHLWENRGDGTFRPLYDVDVGLDVFEKAVDFTFAPNFADVDGDGWPDLLVTGDFGTSEVLINRRDGTFRRVTTPTISDENGMGTALLDVDHDGDLDWFVTSIWDPDQTVAEDENWGITGNRLYRNRGDGTFEDATSEAGLREGYWGWGACASDFDNDGEWDLFHTNGFATFEFLSDPSRLFLGNGDGTFREVSTEVDLEDTGQGRGVVCFDYDRDGDVDLFVANNSGPAKLYRNDGEGLGHFLEVSLSGPLPNSQGIGARVSVVTAAGEWSQVVRLAHNYVSHQPAVLHFGLGEAQRIEQVEVLWPDGSSDLHEDLPVDRFLTLEPGAIAASLPPACRPRADALCLNAGRFEVTATYQTPQGQAGVAGVEPLTADSGYLWFFQPENVELVVKVLDACSFNGHYWVFAAGLTNLQVELRVVDTGSGEERIYASALEQAFQPVQDDRAFGTCP